MRVLSLSLCALTLLAAGCTESMIEPQFDVMGKRMVVIPFKTHRENHFQHQDGIKLARNITNEVLTKNLPEELDMVDSSELENLENEVDVLALGWEEIATELGCDYVCVGEIIRLQTRLPSDIGLARGKIRLEYSVYDYTRDGEVVFSEKREYMYPDPRSKDYLDYSVVESDDDDVRRGLLKLAAKKIALNFYSHYPEDQWE